nr:O-antigen ligase family protein [uncultured Duganella sp.]
MLARLQRVAGRINWLVIGVVALSLFLGVFVALFGTIADGAPAQMAALPALLILLILLTLDRRFLLLGVLVLRASADLVIAGTKIGALINAAVIVLSVLLVFEQPKRFPLRQAAPWMVFLVLGVYALVVSPDKVDGIRSWLCLLSYFAIFIGAFYLVGSREDLMFCVRIVIWSSLLPVLYAFVDIGMNFSSGLRLRSTFGHPNIFAFYLTLVIAMVFYLWKALPPGRESGKRWALGGYLLLLLAMLALTQTRSAWFGCFLLFLGYAVFFERKYLLYMVAMGMVALAVPGVADRLLDLTKNTEIATTARLNSFAWRVFLWQSAFEWMTWRDYIIGRGLQAFKTEAIYFFPQSAGVNWNAHSAYVQIIFEMGLIGLAAFLAPYIATLRRLWRIYQHERLLGFVFLAILVSALFASFSDNVLDYLNFDWYLWFVLGIGCAYAQTLAPAAAPARHQGAAPPGLPGAPPVPTPPSRHFQEPV